MPKAQIVKLTPWQRALHGHVLLCANRRGYFSVQTLYQQAEDHLQEMYPCNKNIRPTIRDELQNLRDKKLVTCIEDGFWQVSLAPMPCCRDPRCCRAR